MTSPDQLKTGISPGPVITGPRTCQDRGPLGLQSTVLVPLFYGGPVLVPVLGPKILGQKTGPDRTPQH